MATIILLRHGENEWVKKNRLAGWIPGVHLNEKGHAQAQAAAERMAALPLKAVYSSPVTRCMETAAYVAAARQLAVLPLEDVGEVRYGEWEGKKIKKLAKKREWHMVQFFPSRFGFPGGETLRAVQVRAVEALERISREHGDDLLAVVSHADVIRLVLAHYLGVHLDLFQRIVIAPGAVSVLALPANGMVRVLRLNDDGPLQPPPAPGKNDGKKKEKKMKEKAENSTVPAAVPAQDEEE